MLSSLPTCWYTAHPRKCRDSALRAVAGRASPPDRPPAGYPAGVSKQTPSSAATTPSGTRPARLTVAAALAAVEGAALAVFGAYLLVMGLIGNPDSPQQAEMGGLTLLALAVLPLAAARGLVLRRRWSRGPALIVQLMAIPVAWTLVSTGGLWTAAGVVLGAVALTVLVLLINPTATEALGIAPRDA